MTDTATLARFVRIWCEKAIAKAGDDPAFEPALVWDDFCRKWFKAKWTMFEGPLGDVFRQAEAAPFPPCAAKYKNEKIRRLVRLCEHQQYQAGDAPWFLTCRQAAFMLGIEPMTVSRALRGFVKDGILREAKPEEIPEPLRKRMRSNSKYYWFDPGKDQNC